MGDTVTLHYYFYANETRSLYPFREDLFRPNQDLSKLTPIREITISPQDTVLIEGLSSKGAPPVVDQVQMTAPLVVVKDHTEWSDVRKLWSFKVALNVNRELAKKSQNGELVLQPWGGSISFHVKIA